MMEDRLTRQTSLSLEIELFDGSVLTTVGDAENYLRHFEEDRHRKSHWDIAVRMFAIAMREPAYLKAATMSFQTALALDGLLMRIRSL